MAEWSYVAKAMIDLVEVIFICGTCIVVAIILKGETK